MRNECMNHRFVFESPMPSGRLVLKVADKSQICTQISSKRPYGVGMLVSAYDEQTGAHLYQTDPSGNYYEYKATAIGARSQSARTYLEKNFETFDSLESMEELVLHALKALQGTTGDNVELTSKNTSISIVGKGYKYRQFEDEDVEPFLALLEENEGQEEGEAMQD